VSRQTVQRMDICRCKVRALTGLGRNETGRGGLNWWAGCSRGSPPRAPRDPGPGGGAPADGRSGNVYKCTWLLNFCFRRETTTNTLGENIEKGLIDLDLRTSRRGTEKNIFFVLPPTLCLHGDWLEGGGYVSG
jgi:hypothetical protein